MKTNPASVHFLANAEFSLNCSQSQHQDQPYQAKQTHKSISWMNALTSLLLSNLYNPIPIKIGRYRTKIERKRRTESMLRSAIRVSVQRCYPDTMLRGSLSNSPTPPLLAIEINQQEENIQSNFSPIRNQYRVQ